MCQLNGLLMEEIQLRYLAGTLKEAWPLSVNRSRGNVSSMKVWLRYLSGIKQSKAIIVEETVS